jgi:hypothetical protein
MNLKLIMLGILMSGSLVAAPIDDVKKNFEGSHIAKSDWVNESTYEKASNSDKYRILTVKLSPTEGVVKIDFTEHETDIIYMAENYCWKLASIAPLVRPDDWSSTTPDETALSNIYTGVLVNGETKRDVIKGWTFVRYRIENTIFCSAKEGA